MHSPIGRYEFTIDAYLADFRGKATLPMIGNFMLQAATKHAEERKFGYHHMKSQQRAWVLSRMAIEMFEYPKNETKFIINTWVANVNRLFTERYFSFENEHGEKLGFAKSIWASIDLETRRPTNVVNIDELTAYINANEPCPIDGVKKILPIKERESIRNFTVKYSDLDINGHLNSMKYIEYFVDLFDLESFISKEIKRLEINYVNEANYGLQMDLYKKPENNDIFVLEMRKDDAIISTSRVTWQ